MIDFLPLRAPPVTFDTDEKLLILDFLLFIIDWEEYGTGIGSVSFLFFEIDRCFLF